MDITKLTEIELKALAYDELIKLENAKKNLEIINREISLRIEATKVTKEE